MVANQVMISTRAVDLGGKAVSISATLATSIAGNNHREAGEYFACSAISQPTRRSEVAPVTVGLERAVGSMTKGMYNAFRCAFAVEMKNLLPHRGILKEIVASRACSERVRSVVLDSIIRRLNLAISVDHCGLQLSKLFELLDHQYAKGHWEATFASAAFWPSTKAPPANAAIVSDLSSMISEIHSVASSKHRQLRGEIRQSYTSPGPWWTMTSSNRQPGRHLTQRSVKSSVKIGPGQLFPSLPKQ